LYKPTITTYTMPDGSYRDAEGRRVTSQTPGAVRHESESPTWWGRYLDASGQPQQVKLLKNKELSRKKLNELEARATRSQISGVPEAVLERKGLSLLDHLAAFEAELRTGRNGKRKRPPSAKHVRQTVGRIRRVLDGCGFVNPSDLARHDALTAVQKFLDGLTAAGEAPHLPPGVEEFKRGELAGLLEVAPETVSALAKRRRLDRIGNGKKRRYPRAAAEALLRHRGVGFGNGTAGYYAREVKRFTNWLADEGFIPRDPLRKLPGAGPTADHRRDRRALGDDELRRVIAAAAHSEVTFRGLTGRDRAILYAVAAATGFRAEEMSTLDPGNFDLGGKVPTATLRGEAAKNGKTACQPIPADLAAALRNYFSGRPAGSAVWPGTWWQKAAEMLQADLELAGVPYVTQGPEGPLYADFHSLRHAFVAALDRAGVSLKQAMQLARHCDPRLTVARYGRAQLHDLGAAVNRLPSLLTPASAKPSAKKKRA
jgi:site-specific recombinase XerD